MMRLGIGIGVGRQRVSGGGFDADYQAVLNYATSLGYTLPSAGQQVKQNQLMLDLKSGGIWSKLDTFVMFATDGSSSFALIDWKRLTTYTNNSCTFSTNGGFTGNGSNGFIDTNFIPDINGVNYKLNDAGRFFWADNRGLGIFYEGNSSSQNETVNNAVSSSNRINQGTNFLNSGVPFDFDGHHAINRTSSTNVELFANTTQYSRTANSFILPTVTQWILRRGISYGTMRFRYYAMGGNLVSQNTEFRTAINTYLTSL